MEPVEVTSVSFPSAGGVEIEGDLLCPTVSTGTAVVCHPHPMYGGNRHDGVVGTICRSLVDSGRRVLRFDFRGAGGSSGSHGGGLGELDDLKAAIDSLDVAQADLIIAGYSFGADIALNLCPAEAVGWLAIAPPLSVFDTFAAAHDPRPKQLVAGAHDQFRSAAELSDTVRQWTATSVHTVDTTDHFFQGAHPRIAEVTQSFSSQLS